MVFSEHLTLTSIWLVLNVSQSTGIGGTWVGQVLRIGSPGVGGALGPSARLSPLWKDPHISAPRQVFKIMWKLPLPFQLLSWSVSVPSLALCPVCFLSAVQCWSCSCTPGGEPRGHHGISPAPVMVAQSVCYCRPHLPASPRWGPELTSPGDLRILSHYDNQYLTTRDSQPPSTPQTQKMTLSTTFLRMQQDSVDHSYPLANQGIAHSPVIHTFSPSFTGPSSSLSLAWFSLFSPLTLLLSVPSPADSPAAVCWRQADRVSPWLTLLVFLAASCCTSSVAPSLQHSVMRSWIGFFLVALWHTTGIQRKRYWKPQCFWVSLAPSQCPPPTISSDCCTLGVWSWNLRSSVTFCSFHRLRLCSAWESL